jgi:hypothetical protein
LLRFFTRNMNDNGTLPWARFEGLWTAVYHAGDIERASQVLVWPGSKLLLTYGFPAI